MINAIWIFVIKALIRLRYRVRIIGLDKILSKGRKGILILPNHPALIDPIILIAHLYNTLQPRALADRHQIDRPLIGHLAKKTGVIPIDDMAVDGADASGRVRDTIMKCADSLTGGDNVVLYPAGHILRTKMEEIGANSAVQTIVKRVPDTRIVLVRTQGLWGSSFSWASGNEPSIPRVLRDGLADLLISGVFFAPKREVTIEFHEPEDFPRTGSRTEINRYLERHYNSNPTPNTYVPYTPFEYGGSRQMPEPKRVVVHGDPADVSSDIRSKVYEYLKNASEVDQINDDTVLSSDLGMDSLMMADLLVHLQSEYNYPSNSFESILTVGDALLAASGEAGTSSEPISQPQTAWTARRPTPSLPDNLMDMNIPQAFLHQAEQYPDCAISADEVSGVKTFRNLVLGCTILKNEISRLDGDNTGIMMPASLAGNTMYLATLFAGKTPAMINWTLGRKQLESCLETGKIMHILTSRALTAKLKKRQYDLGRIEDKFVYIEDIVASIGLFSKLKAMISSRISWSSLKRSAERCSDTAVILFTSGSEAAPKAVPLTHTNILSNIRDVYECFSVTSNDCMVGILPPFHSFGLSITTILPLVLGLRSVYTPDPTAGGKAAAVIGAYEGTIVAGTPTFLSGIIRSGSPDQLASLRLGVTGAEKCPESLFNRIARKCPNTTIIEGYGATECSPIISANHESDTRLGTIGRMMRSLHYLLIDPDNGDINEHHGQLLVRGPSVFNGYLGDTPTPFVERDGHQWYDTGDIVKVSDEGIVTFKGRIKRFVKIGGEMISLPAIEEAISPHLTDPSDKGPAFAITYRESQKRPEIILVTTREIERGKANELIVKDGLSGLHRITDVIKVDQLPLLGSGKTDYRSLREMVTENERRENG